MMKSYLNSEKMNRFLNFTVLASVKTRLAMIVLLVALFSNIGSVSAATRTASVTGNWNSTATWGGAAVPTSLDDVTINSGITVTVNLDATCKSLTFLGTSATSNALTVNSTFTLTVTNGVVLNSCNTTTGFNTACAISGGGTLTCASLLVGTDFGTTNTTTRTTIMTSTITNLNVTGDLTVKSFTGTTSTKKINSSFNFASGTLNIGGVITTSNENAVNTSTFTNSTGDKTGVLLLSNSSPFKTAASGTSTIVLNGTGTTVNYTGTAQTIRATTYNDLTLSGSGTKTLAGNTIVNKDITIDSGVTLDITNDDLTVKGNIIINGTCTSSNDNPGKIEWDTDGGILSGAGTFSDIQQLDTNTLPKTISATANITFTNASIDGDGNIITNNGIVNISGSNGFASGSATTWANVGTLNYGSPTFLATLTATGSNNTVNYTGTAQTIKTTTYNNLTLSGSGIKTFGAATTINNTLSIETAVVANLGIFTHTAGVLNIGGEDAVTGSWGSTSSSAENKDDVYFGATSGTISNSCTAPTITTQPVGLTICENTGGDFTVVTSTVGSTFQWQYSVNNGVNWIVTNAVEGFSGHTTATLTITTIPSAYNGYRIRCIVRSNTGCRTNTSSVLLTVAPLSAPTLGTITQPTCATPTTGSVDLTNLPIGGTLSHNNGTSTTEISYSGTTATVSGLAVGTYTFTVSNGSCVSAASANVAILPLVTNTWNGTSWSPNIPTDVLHLDQNIVFEGDYGANKNLYGCSCEVKSGAVVIHENYTLKVTNDVKVTGGSLTFLNTASLVQTNNVTNTGNITYNRTTPTVRTTDYIYWSSPVSGQTIADFSPTVGSIKYYYDLGWKAPSDSDVMAKGLGYIIRGQVTSNNKYDASFVGVPNNGPASITANTSAKYYLVGNPYPSAIDAVEFLDQNAGLDGNIYLWTHNTEIAKNASGTELVYTSDDYATYNSIVGGVATNQANKPIGKIAAGQSFFVKTIAATTIQFNNDMRVGSKSDDKEQNSQFFRTTNGNTTKSKTAVVEKHRLWLNLTNDQGAFKQTLLAYVTGATNDLDARYDGQNFNGNSFINFYSISNTKNYTIQARALPFDNNDEVALGFKSTMKGSFTIAIDEVDGLLANQDVFIEDKLKGTTFNLKTGNYTFDTEIGTFNERFVIRYTDKTLATQDFTIAPNEVLVSVKNKQIKINAGETIERVVVYDLLGKQIYTKTAVNSNELVFSNIVSGQQTLLVKVVLQNGSTSTKKIIY